jgi:uncharacterized membrane protein YgaE (UPF0421/DUF939 family)
MKLMGRQDSGTMRPPVPSISRACGQGAALAIACFISYAFITDIISRVYLISRDGQLLGGMWAAVVTVCVYREDYQRSMSVVLPRISATLLGFVLCLIYLLIFPFGAWGMAVLIGIGALALTLVGRSEDVVTTGVTTTVMMAAAGISPQHAWKQPILLLVDTLVGTAAGVLAAWVSTTIEAKINLQPARTRVVQSR